MILNEYLSAKTTSDARAGSGEVRLDAIVLSPPQMTRTSHSEEKKSVTSLSCPYLTIQILGCILGIHSLGRVYMPEYKSTVQFLSGTTNDMGFPAIIPVARKNAKLRVHLMGNMENYSFPSLFCILDMVLFLQNCCFPTPESKCKTGYCLATGY